MHPGSRAAPPALFSRLEGSEQAATLQRIHGLIQEPKDLGNTRDLVAKLRAWVRMMEQYNCVELVEVSGSERLLWQKGSDVAEDPSFYLLVRGQVQILKEPPGERLEATGIPVLGESVAQAPLAKSGARLKPGQIFRPATIIALAEPDQPTLLLKFNYAKMANQFGRAVWFDNLRRSLNDLLTIQQARADTWRPEEERVLALFREVMEGQQQPPIPPIPPLPAATERMIHEQFVATLLYLGAKTLILGGVRHSGNLPEIGLRAGMNIALSALVLMLIVAFADDLWRSAGQVGEKTHWSRHLRLGVHTVFISIANTLVTVREAMNQPIHLKSIQSVWDAISNPLTHLATTVNPPFFAETLVGLGTGALMVFRPRFRNRLGYAMMIAADALATAGLIAFR